MKLIAQSQLSLSVTSNANNDTYCFIADRDAGRSGVGENFVRWIKLLGGSFEEVDIGKDDGRKICRPVDVEAVGVPPTCTPTTNTLTCTTMKF